VVAGVKGWEKTFDARAITHELDSELRRGASHSRWRWSSRAALSKSKGGPLPFQATINAVDSSAGSSQGILIFDYTVTGTPGTVVDILAEHTTPSPVTDTGPPFRRTPAPSGFVVRRSSLRL
jgi:hypothetical protein